MKSTLGLRIHITGLVQGVGFRPFIYSLAMRNNIQGWVRNTSAGVDIQVDGTKIQLDTFIHQLHNELPPLSRIDSFETQKCSPEGFTKFEIIPSEAIPGAFIPISPDVSICDDCLREMFDPDDRRYRYPFINCTNCGPRFTIIKDIPYDRPKTTMAPFEMCPACRAEYENPLDRRFHAQPVACPVCGPHVWLDSGQSNPSEHNKDDAISKTLSLLLQGKIIGIKGLGGFHLACDATNHHAVTELRNRKLRIDKPFAVMMPDISTIEKFCFLNDVEKKILTSRERPIVLLRAKPASNIVPAVAPQQKTIGVMLPYTPLHYLLFQGLSIPALVMTSGNFSEEPIAYANNDALDHLSGLADAFLLHNRKIHTRCDDSVVRLADSNSSVTNETKFNLYPIRRSRGYAPNPIKLPWKNSPKILATGPELKNTFCIAKEEYAFLSHHIGDMENYETLKSFEEGIEHYERLFKINPEVIACDLHPNYLASRYAENRAKTNNLELIKIQHHHAHIAACMADQGLQGERPVIGVSFDGTGYGDDHAIWGGEFLVADYQGYQRYAHLEYFPLPGGDAAIRNPARIALSQLWEADIDWDDDLPAVKFCCGDEMSLLRSMLNNAINCPVTSSIGRLFDSVAALVGVRGLVNYEGQAAIELEALADPNEKSAYSLDFDNGMIICKNMLHEIINDLRADVPTGMISSRFHNGLANVILQVCNDIKTDTNLREVVLSGGVWQNIILLNKTIPLLQRSNFKVYIHNQVPTNDGGIALGQVAIARNQLLA
jgi:hydrogenase maturation protein HypF